MKKRILAMLLIMTMVFSLSACGDSNETPVENQRPTDTPVATTENTNEDNITFETPIILTDNEFCKLELLRIWKREGERHYNGLTWDKTDEGVSYGIDVQFYNKSDIEYSISLDAYIGDDAVVNRLNVNNNSHINGSPAPGKNAMMRITIARWDGDKELPMDMEELYQLNGSFQIFGDSKIPNRTKFSFDFRDVISTPTLNADNTQNAEGMDEEAIYQKAVSLLNYGEDVDYEANAEARDLLLSIPGYKDTDEILTHIIKVVKGRIDPFFEGRDECVPNGYDEYGRLIKEGDINLELNSSGNMDAVDTYNYHTYDEKGNRILTDFGDGKIYYGEYDDNGNMTRWWSPGVSDTHYTYNDKNQCVKSEATGLVNYTTTYKYTAEGELEEQKMTYNSGYSKGKSTYYNYQYTYTDGKVVAVSKTYIDTEGDVEAESWRVTYDEDGDPIVGVNHDTIFYGYVYAPKAN